MPHVAAALAGHSGLIQLLQRHVFVVPRPPLGQQRRPVQPAAGGARAAEPQPILQKEVAVLLMHLAHASVCFAEAPDEVFGRLELEGKRAAAKAFEQVADVVRRAGAQGGNGVG